MQSSCINVKWKINTLFLKHICETTSRFYRGIFINHGACLIKQWLNPFILEIHWNKLCLHVYCYRLNYNSFCTPVSTIMTVSHSLFRLFKFPPFFSILSFFCPDLQEKKLLLLLVCFTGFISLVCTFTVCMYACMYLCVHMKKNDCLCSNSLFVCWQQKSTNGFVLFNQKSFLFNLLCTLIFLQSSLEGIGRAACTKQNCNSLISSNDCLINCKNC